MIYYFYKITSEDVPDYIYVGSTRALANRKYHHKSNCNNENSKEYNRKVYKTIRENGGWDNWRMVCIHQGEYSDKRSAEIKEEELRVELNANMNSQRCFITQEQLKEEKREYYHQNKEHYKDYSEQNKEQIKEYQKEYREKNKEYFKKRDKEYYSENKEQINERRYKKFECECGGRYTLQNKARHIKSKQHQNYLKENANE